MGYDLDDTARRMKVLCYVVWVGGVFLGLWAVARNLGL